MKNYIVVVWLACLFTSCQQNNETYLYKHSLFQIEVPKGWLEEESTKSMLFGANENAKEKILSANYHVIIIEPEKNLYSGVKQNSERNCLRGVCKSTLLKKRKINNQPCYEVCQDIIINNQRLIIRQYYFEGKDIVYRLSFVHLKSDGEKTNKLFNKIVNSFIFKI
ncbi:hypothetical protein FA048_18660 [Pedobacter polaris]|uniref:Uncharacterized protein n=1 Tax=Pedobacter polaris TaxID=2571273 RepID=A0A4U1CCU4_9SPHI|nr:PsbP-related protein [Pedobacter polaris]TKC04710.1 hypothetical protein FA048_18660 [Pedobacter polaris]